VKRLNWVLICAGMFVATSLVIGQGRGNSPFSETGGRFITESKEFENDATFTVPNGVTRLMVELWGAGGGGAAGGPAPFGQNSQTIPSTGQGGGGGAYGRFFLDVVAGQTVSIHIGQGGSGGSATGDPTGGDGGDTWVSFGPQQVTAAGGKGGRLALQSALFPTGGPGGSRNPAAAISRAGLAGGHGNFGQSFPQGGSGGQVASGGTVLPLSGSGGNGGGVLNPPHPLFNTGGIAGSNGYALLSW
jgi:hypothetical protein